MKLLSILLLSVTWASAQVVNTIGYNASTGNVLPPSAPLNFAAGQLKIGGFAINGIGTAAGTAAAGNDPRFTFSTITNNSDGTGVGSLSHLTPTPDQFVEFFDNNNGYVLKYIFQLGRSDATSWPSFVRDEGNTGVWCLISMFDRDNNYWGDRFTILPGGLLIPQDGLYFQSPGQVISGQKVVISVGGGTLGNFLTYASNVYSLSQSNFIRYNGAPANITQAMPTISANALDGITVYPGYEATLWNDDATTHTVTLVVNGTTVILQPGDRIKLSAVAAPNVWRYQVSRSDTDTRLAAVDVPIYTGSLLHTCTNNPGPAQAFHNFSNLAITVQTGDVLRYWMLSDSMNDDYLPGVDLVFTDNTRLGNYTVVSNDFQGISYGFPPKLKWIHREITVPSQANGKTTSFAVFQENTNLPNTRTFNTYYRQIELLRAGKVFAQFWKSGVPSVNVYNGGANVSGSTVTQQ